MASAVPPISKQATALVKEAPRYVERLQRDTGWVAKLNRKYHIVDNLRKRAEKGPTLEFQAIGGVIGVGKAVLSAVFSTPTVVILTTYFLGTSSRTIPRSNAERCASCHDHDVPG